MSNPKAQPARHLEHEFVPAASSPNWQYMSSEMQQHWRGIMAVMCQHCGQPIGENCWIASWDSKTCEHLSCREDWLKAEENLLNNPGLIEDASKAAHLTIEGFKALPSWTRLRHIQQISQARPV